MPTFGFDKTAETGPRNLAESIKGRKEVSTEVIPVVDPVVPPVVDPAKKATSPGIISTVPIHIQGAKDSSALDAALKLYAPTTQGTETQPATDLSSDPYLTGLNDMAARSNESTKRLVANIQAAKLRQSTSLDKQFGDYQKGLQLLGIQHNDAQASPDLLMGHIQESENQHKEKLAALDAEENKALMDAENARADNDFKILKEKMDYVKEIKKEKANTLKDLHDALSQTTDIADIQAHTIYDTMQTLDDASKATFLQAVARKYQIPLASLVTSLADEKVKRDKASLDKRNSESILANRGAGGGSAALSKAQIAQGINILKTGKSADGTVVGNAQGNDGFYDPGVYLALYKDWPGSNESFLKAYPSKGNINPDSYDILPDALRPKTSTSSGGQTS